MRDKAATPGAGLRAQPYARSALGGFRKRALDVVITSLALLVLTPILIVMAGLIRLLIGKSVVVNEWIGLGGKTFASYQFWPAVVARQDTSSALLRLNDLSWAESLVSALHMSSLDKLPLLFNVLRGDMSLFGPRPITADEVSRYCRLMPEYFAARPGLTGLWRHTYALNLRRPATQMTLDRYYIRYWSVRLDLTLLINSISAMP
jgi:lipopolysaccharide/colanic/teichoic acid biosynthesis glycosyltransferase